MDYLDDTLPAEESERLEEHLRACPPCVDFLRTYRATPDLCRRALEKEMPVELSEKLTEFLRQKIGKK